MDHIIIEKNISYVENLSCVIKSVVVVVESNVDRFRVRRIKLH